MFGAVKIQSRCPTWLGLTALDFHFASQPLPLPLGWYVLQAPPSINRLAVAVTLLIEGPWTFFLLAPHPTLRSVGAPSSRSRFRFPLYSRATTISSTC
ncbi:hypothetical protein KRP22_003186 [Phytophthora ramorum]|nr:Lipase maturation factor 2 [Phytophthora ramorum]